MPETLKNKTITGLSWSFVERFGQQIISFISSIILIYILTPQEYGLIAVLSIFIIIGDILIDSGFNRGLINKKEATQEDYNTIFGFNLFISILIYTIFYFCAPLIADFYEKPELKFLSRVLFLIIPLNALASIQNVLLIKRVNFKTRAKVILISLLISSTTAIILAYQGFGVWTLVIQNVILASWKSLLFWIFNNWRPSFHLRIKTLKELFPFGSKLLAVSLLNAFSKNIYSPLIGYYYNMEQTGYYDQANKYQTIPVSIIGDTFRSVSVPVFSEAANDRARLKNVMHKMIKTIAFFIFPIIFCLIIIIQPLFTILQLSEKWGPAIPVFQILCFGGILHVFYTILLEAIISKGRSGIALGIEIFSKIFIIISILLFIKQGIEGLAMSWVSYTVVSLILVLFFTSKVLKYSHWNFIKDILPYLLLALVAAFCGWLCSGIISNNYFYILINVFIFISLYIGIGLCFKMEIHNEVKKWFFRYLNKKKSS